MSKAKEDGAVKSEFSDGGGSPVHEARIDRVQEEFKERHRRLHKQELKNSVEAHWFLDHLLVKGTIFAMVFLSCMQLGLEAELPQFETTWKLCEHYFTAAFTVEMVLKVVLLRCRYFRDRWNVLDFSLCVMSICDAWVLPLTDTGGSNLQNLSILRMLRLVRLSRAVRVVRNFKKLVVMIEGIIDALKSALWVSVALFIAIYICAIFCKTIFDTTDKAALYPSFSTDLGDIDQQGVVLNFNPHVYFGTLGRSMLTLFNIATMMEWGEVIWPVAFKQPAMLLFFVPFIVLMAYGLLNVVVGMIVENVMDLAKVAAKDDNDYDLQCKIALLDEIQHLWHNFEDPDGNFNIGKLEEEMHNQDSHLRVVLQRVELPRGFSAADLVMMLNEDGDEKLNHAEFVAALYRLLDCGSFQQACLLQKGLNEVKKMSGELSRKVDDLSKALCADGKLGGLQADACDSRASPCRSDTSRAAQNLETKFVGSGKEKNDAATLVFKHHSPSQEPPLKTQVPSSNVTLSEVGLVEAAHERDRHTALLVEMNRMLCELKTTIQRNSQVPEVEPSASKTRDALPVCRVKAEHRLPALVNPELSLALQHKVSPVEAVARHGAERTARSLAEDLTSGLSGSRRKNRAAHGVKMDL